MVKARKGETGVRERQGGRERQTGESGRKVSEWKGKCVRMVEEKRAKGKNEEKEK